MIEFKVRDIAYKASAMPVKTQWFVFRRVAPILFPLVHLFGKKQLSIDEAMSFMASLCSLSDEDSGYVISTCMRLCERQNTVGGWSRIWDINSDQAMFDDINMVEMGLIIWEVLQGFLGNFSQGLPWSSLGESQASTSTP